MTNLKAGFVLRCFRIVAAVSLLACGRCAPSIHDTHVPRRTTPLSRDYARLSFQVARPPFLIFYFGFEETAEKFRRGLLPPLFRLSMVRTYIRKGGHGGDRSKAGLPACYWQEKGGRAAGAAAAAKAAAKAKELLEEQAAKAAATNRWKQWAKYGDEQQSTSNQLQIV